MSFFLVIVIVIVNYPTLLTSTADWNVKTSTCRERWWNKYQLTNSKKLILHPFSEIKSPNFPVRPVPTPAKIILPSSSSPSLSVSLIQLSWHPAAAAECRRHGWQRPVSAAGGRAAAFLPTALMSACCWWLMLTPMPPPTWAALRWPPGCRWPRHCRHLQHMADRRHQNTACKSYQLKSCHL